MLDPYFANLRDSGLALRPKDWRPELDAIRKGMALETAALGAGPQLRQVVDHTIATRSGQIALREFVPENPKAIAAFIHGGGWAAGTIEDFDSLGRALAQASQCIVMLPEYRLAPEHVYPAGLEDVQDALVWMANRAQAAGLPLVGLGDSAGANLVLAAALELGDAVDLKHISALYPVADCDFDTPSYRACGQGQLFSAVTMKLFFDTYAPADIWDHPTISVAKHPALADLPPVLVLTCGYDLLCDDGIALIDALKAQGCQPEHIHLASAPHGFLRHHAQSDLAAKALQQIAASITKALNG